MNTYLQPITSVTSRTMLTALLCSALLLPSHAVWAETTVTNTVQVSASGTGENRASITTIIDGRVVVDETIVSNGPIVYSSHTATTTTFTSGTTITPSQDEDNDQLKALIDQLQALISLYVSLLNS